MKNLALIFILAITTYTALAQVGINTIAPTTTLDVNGDVISDGSLFIENPGEVSQIRNSKLLIVSPTDYIVKYDIEESKYGPINYAQFVFRNLSKDGLLDYDTKISTDKYIVTVQGYYFLETGSNDTDIMSRSSLSTDNVEGYQIYAYKNAATQTWFLRAFVNNSQFYTRIGGVFLPTPIDMYLNLIIYRNGFISKEKATITVNMGGNETGTAALPDGF